MELSIRESWFYYWQFELSIREFYPGIDNSNCLLGNFILLLTVWTVNSHGHLLLWPLSQTPKAGWDCRVKKGRKNRQRKVWQYNVTAYICGDFIIILCGQSVFCEHYVMIFHGQSGLCGHIVMTLYGQCGFCGHCDRECCRQIVVCEHFVMEGWGQTVFTDTLWWLGVGKLYVVDILWCRVWTNCIVDTLWK